MDYTLFPFNPGWPDDELDLKTARERKKQIMNVADERIEMLLAIMRSSGDLYWLDPENIMYNLGAVENIETWLLGHVVSVEGTVLDMSLTPRGNQPLPRRVVNNLTPMASSLCTDLGLLFSRVVMHNCQDYEWKVLNYKHGHPEIVIRNPRSRSSFSPWRAMFSALVAAIEYKDPAPIIRLYASVLQVPPLR